MYNKINFLFSVKFVSLVCVCLQKLGIEMVHVNFNCLLSYLSWTLPDVTSFHDTFIYLGSKHGYAKINLLPNNYTLTV
jgi:hypothetical protein